ncbi:MAG: hypothetical protein HQL24_01900 [Candidatus Omnitrophica bacterium]|nr:hypothetical protein [Candidatus Omnitrophota bacterium]
MAYFESNLRKFFQRFSPSFFIFSIIVIGVYLFFADFALMRWNTADGSTYLNIAENIANHKGFVVSYNFYHCFTGLYHPLWPYMQPLYPILCSLFVTHGGITQVIRVNIFILGINSALIFFLLQSLIRTRLNILFLFSLIFSFHFFISALACWTEQLHLLLFIISFILFIKFSAHRRILFWLGALNGLMMLVRFAHLYNFAAYILVILIGQEGREPFRDRLKSLISFSSGFILIFGSYELLNLIFFHSLYPQYAQPGANYYYASKTALATYRFPPGICIPPTALAAVKHQSFFLDHMKNFLLHLSLFAIPLALAFRIPRENIEQRYFILNCLCQSLFVIVGYSFLLDWLDYLRYALIPHILTALAGWLCLYELFFRSPKKWRKLFAIGVLVVLTFLSLQSYYARIQRILYPFAINYPQTKSPYYKDFLKSFSWIDQNLPKEILVASDENQEAYLMHRPFISLPPGESYNCHNLNLYNKIYAPDYYLLSSDTSNECFNRIPHEQIFSNRTFRLLRIKKGAVYNPLKK